jgi:hypothetical protein
MLLFPGRAQQGGGGRGGGGGCDHDDGCKRGGHVRRAAVLVVRMIKKKVGSNKGCMYGNKVSMYGMLKYMFVHMYVGVMMGICDTCGNMF